MSDFTFIHAADIHLDSPLRGLERYEGAPVEEIRNATRVAFTKLVDLAIEEGVAFVVIAGDIYDGDWRDYNTGLFFVKEMSRLRGKKIPVYILTGNHDAASVITRQLPLPDNVFQFSTSNPETFRIEKLAVALHGQGFAKREVLENLSTTYPQAAANCFNIGVLHTSATGNPEHDTYAPCSVSDLASKGYDYWALGHVHKREVLSEAPWIVFPGNLQGRHIREQGAKGCTLVTVSEREIVSVEPRDLDVLRWAEIAVDCAEATALSDLSSQVVETIGVAMDANGDRILATRLILSGICAFHADLSRNREDVIAEMRATVLGDFGETVWIEKVVFNTRSAEDWNRKLQDGSPAADLLQLLDQVAGDDQEVAELIDQLSDLRNKIPADASNSDGAFTSEWMRLRLREVREEILPRLLQETE